MSNFDSIRFQFENMPAEQKLAVLGFETRVWIVGVRGFGKMIQQAVEEPQIAAITPDLVAWSTRLLEHVEKLSDLMDGIISPHYRNRGLPELRPYGSLLEAVHQTAQRLGSPLAAVLDDPSRILVQDQYPLVLLDEPKHAREIMFSLVESGYSVELLALSDQHLFQVEFQVLPSSLEGVISVIHQWLVEQRAVSEIQLDLAEGAVAPDLLVIATQADTRRAVINQGDVFWARLDAPDGTEAGYPHPQVVIQDNTLTHSRIKTVVVCGLTSNLKRASLPGNVLLEAGEANLARPSVVVVSQVSTLEKTQLGEYIGSLSEERVRQILAGMRFLQLSTESRE